MSEPLTVPDVLEDVCVQQLPPFRVILHNDDVNTVEHVIHAILTLTNLSEQEAILRTLEAHETGLSLLLVTPQGTS